MQMIFEKGSYISVERPKRHRQIDDKWNSEENLEKYRNSFYKTGIYKREIVKAKFIVGKCFQ